MFAETDDSLHQPSVRIVEFEKKGPNCGFHLTRGKWDPYPWVSQVDDDSVSNLAGLKPGDCLLEVNDEDIVGKKICEIAELVKNKTGKVSLLVWNAGVDPHCSPEVYNSVVEAFDLKEENKDNTAQKIQQIFKPKPKNKIIPNIKVTQCHTNNFLSKLMGKSSSVDNLSSNFKFLSPNDSETMKIKSLSSNEIFQAETPTVSRAGSILKLSRRKDNNTTTMDDSLTNISDFEDRPASFHGSVEFLDNHLSERSDTNEELCKNQLTFHCPFQSKCTSLIKENEIMQHFETNHEGPLVQYFGKTIQISIRKLDNENCFMINNAGCTYFVKTYANSEVTLGDSSTSDIFLWCWYLGTKIGAKSFELEVELKTTSLKMPFFRVRSPISSLHSTSFYDIKEFNKGIFLNSETIKSLGCVDDIILNISIIPTDV
ncbi:uncharacterized protein LOC115875092 isoform X2 [Sitophilus oryzae]|uniref:Uncharacterized protein LOC115875092 isoform X2 n=1 Tax=Sitophilus oryzae TaxID=7048 RepID=A0A6J2X5P9_SITOR|nr:uncharacterized protein LOC115875092 isoform X2 [Sitophilus oryzae]